MPYKAAPLPTLPPGTLQLEDVPVSEPAPFLSAQDRSDDQRKIDAAVLHAHQQWIAAGSPEASRGALARVNSLVPRKRYLFPPEHAETIQKMLNRAATYNGVRVIQSEVKRHKSGAAMIYWTAVDRGERKPKEPHFDRGEQSINFPPPEED